MTQEFYALGNDRSVRAVRGFLDHFLPNREPCATEYPIPECSHAPKLVLKTELEILDYLERHIDESYGLYWNDARIDSAQAMLFYTRDGKVIYGLAEFADDLKKRLNDLAEFVGAEYSMLGSEQRPPDNAAEFITLCRIIGE